MLHCFTASTSSSATTTTNAAHNEATWNSSDGIPRTPGTGFVPSPTVNLTREYAQAIQTNSFSEIWSKIHVVEQFENEEPGHQPELLLSEVLKLDREFVEEALRHAIPTTFTQLVSAYFEHSEKTCHLLVLLRRNIYHAKSLYAPIHDLVETLSTNMDAITQSQCNHAFEVFSQFDQGGNPFPCPDFHYFLDVHHCFSELKQQVDHRLQKSRGRVRLVRHATTGSAICLIGTVVGVVVSAVVIATHALVVLVAAASICPAVLPSKILKREGVCMRQLNAAAKSAFVLHNELDTIDRLVARLYTAVEGDKLLIQLGLDRGREKYSIYEVVKQLGKNRKNVIDQSKDLEEHICLCFDAINKARSNLLEEMLLHQACS